jgi:hypothetical protein
MNPWLKLGVPLLLGCGAAVINWQVLQSELEPHYFVKVTKEMKPGDLFKKDTLEKVTIRNADGAGSLDSVAVAWKEHYLLFDTPCVRELKANDIVFQRDAPSRFKVIQGLEKNERALLLSLDEVKYEPALLMVGTRISFVCDKDSLAAPGPTTGGTSPKLGLGSGGSVVLGPFRILSVGRRVTPESESDASDSAAARVISIAVKTEMKNGVEVLEDNAERVQRALGGAGGGPKPAVRIMLYPYKD